MSPILISPSTREIDGAPNQVGLWPWVAYWVLQGIKKRKLKKGPHFELKEL